MAEKSIETRIRELPQDLLNRGFQMAGRGRDIWLAGLGAVATVEEEGTGFFGNLVERGKKLESTGKAKAREIRVRDIPQEALTMGRDMVGRSRDVWLAGLGAVAAVEEEGGNLFGTLVERGKKLEDRGLKQVGTVRSEISARQKEVTDSVETSVYEPLLGALKRFGVPTRAEVRDLATSVDALARKVDSLISRLQQQPAEPAAEPAQQEAAATEQVFSIVAREEGWALRKEGRQSDISVHATKDEALEAGRAYAGERAPSRLEVYKKDGSLQDTIVYDS